LNRFIAEEIIESISRKKIIKTIYRKLLILIAIAKIFKFYELLREMNVSFIVTLLSLINYYKISTGSNLMKYGLAETRIV
jgi:hypothetical protein